MNAPLTRRHFKSAIGSAFVAFNAGMDALMPPACVLCGCAENLNRHASVDQGNPLPMPRETRFICGQCEYAIRNSWPASAIPCQFCGMPRPADPAISFGLPCGSCPESGFVFDEVIVVGIYQQAVREAVVAAKLARHASIAVVLGQMLGELAASRLAGQMVDLVTYVPSHLWRRLQRRSVGGVALMANEVAREIFRPVEPIVKMTRHVKKQAMLPDSERIANVRDAFALKKKYDCGGGGSINGKHILLVDDVLTTGSTASEITGVLKAAGAAKVTLAVVARAVRR